MPEDQLKQRTVYSKTNPYRASLIERYNLCSRESNKETYHLTLDIAESGISYEVGDCIGVAPANDPKIAEKLLKLFGVQGDESVVTKRDGESLAFHEFLLRKANLVQVNKKFFSKVAEKAHCKKAKERFMEMLGASDPDLLKAHLEERHVPDLIEEAGGASVEPQEVVDLLMPLMPRFYSIASSLRTHPGEVHLTVAKVSYELLGQPRGGVCTHYLSERTPLKQPEIPIFLQPHSGFTIPKDSMAPMIMIGPGTGVAPFRAFMQERQAIGAKGKNWLFFGDWYQDGTFLYGDYWRQMHSKEGLKLDLAFSRDQESKIYVQHRMLEKGKELHAWLQEGAYLYVCGDAKRMARDVEAALLQILAEHGGMTDEEAKDYVRSLRKTGRYLRDVY
ncbi:diflavin oxidoreductase [Estrella lausannensis]|uniref:assimilatory sulfite reductase (NADPH) n=1 Tax=Estrella lausannensis TaxID=483423 RepID=A0A0H5E6S4_9BACT|nr:sulfite reductase [Estrella lausannensis]CRX38990.1 Putative sulfite reductase [NADPH] flavoprotein alpha-component [Estrella lausannensis]